MNKKYKTKNGWKGSWARDPDDPAIAKPRRKIAFRHWWAQDGFSSLSSMTQWYNMYQKTKNQQFSGHYVPWALTIIVQGAYRK